MNKGADMKDNEKNSLQEVKSQLDDIRNVMKISSSTFSMIYKADNFRKLFILSGVFSIVLPLMYQVLLWVYKSASGIPVYMQIIFYALIAVCWLILIIVRTKVSINEAKRLGMKSDILSIIDQILSTKMWLAIFPVLIFMIVIPIKYSASFALTDYMPYYGIVLGLILNMIGVMIREREYTYAGLWMVLSGACLLFIFAIPMHIAFAVILAPGCFLFAIINKHLENINEDS
jgi:hypothetical protein